MVFFTLPVVVPVKTKLYPIGTVHGIVEVRETPALDSLKAWFPALNVVLQEAEKFDNLPKALYIELYAEAILTVTLIPALKLTKSLKGTSKEDWKFESMYSTGVTPVWVKVIFSMGVLLSSVHFRVNLLSTKERLPPVGATGAAAVNVWVEVEENW